ncbi:MAG: hypothetical protein ACO39Y_10120, partial [Ilumatobacteraceae bacterium]
MNAVSDEDRLDRGETLGVLRRAYQVASAQRRFIRLALGLVVLSTMVTLAGPTLVRYAIDNGIKKGDGGALNTTVVVYVC